MCDLALLAWSEDCDDWMGSSIRGSQLRYWESGKASPHVQENLDKGQPSFIILHPYPGTSAVFSRSLVNHIR